MPTATAPSVLAPASETPPRYAFSAEAPDLPKADPARASWSDAQWEAWAATATDEEKFVELKAAVQVAFDEIDAGLGIRVSSQEEHEAFFRDLLERAGERARARRAAQSLAAVS